ncbi:MAG: zinc ribbon domain-containing protein [Candidatus Omnitrophota bacterium]
MPIYEYNCNKCRHRFEFLVRSSGEKVICPKCGKADLNRLMSGFSFASRDKSGALTASSSGCSGCSSHNCATCSH